MAEEKKPDGQGDLKADGQGGQNAQAGQAGSQGDGKPVSYESWQKLLGEEKKTAAENKKLQAELEKFKNAEKKAGDEKLKADGKLQELVESKDKDIAAKTERIRKAELKVAAKGAGLVDLDQVELLMKTAKFNDQDELENGEELFKELKEKKPYLFEQPEPDPKPGTKNAGSNWKGRHIYTNNEIDAMPDDVRKKSWPEILSQMGEGLVK